MTNEAINRYIHTEIMGKHWHVHPDPNDPDDSHCECGMDGQHFGFDNHDYTSDSSPRSLLNEVVAKVVERTDKALGYQLWGEIDTQKHSQFAYSHVITSVLTMPAEQIARACVKAWKSTTGETK